LLDAVRTFVKRVRGLSGVHRIALMGSLSTAKEHPKDADLLVFVDDDAGLAPLALAARQLKGQAQSKNSGADIFVATPRGEYVGRICHYRECRPGVRMSCRAQHCGRRPHLCDDLHVLKLRTDLVQAPPVELWPSVIVRARIPADVQELVTAIGSNESP
jgi:hypothetical protein